MSTRKHLNIIPFALILFLFGCSSGGIKAPTLPGVGANNQPYSNIAQIPVGVSEALSDGSAYSGTGTLGMFSVHLDPVSLTGEMSLLRQGSLEDVLEIVDITNFLMLAPCSNCAKINAISLDGDGCLVLTIGVKHPFGPGDPLKPISGQNRADLHVFNVEGFVISDGAMPSAFGGLGQTIGDFRIVNADGYSSYMDESWDAILETEATIHPYITHFDDYSVGNFDAGNPTGFASVTDPPPSGKLVMAMGSDYDYQDYVLDITLDGEIEFMFAVGCTYAVSAAKPNARFSPEYRVPQHNKKAASEVWVEVTNNELKSEDDTSIATIQVNVVDINHGVVVGTGLDEMFADSSVSEILVEAPGVTSGSVPFSTTPISGIGHDPADPLVFEGTISNDALAEEGTYNGLVKVIDTYLPGQNTADLLDGMDGITRVGPIDNPLTGLFAIDEFATYQTFSIFVEESCIVPTDADYNLTISTVRSSTDEITALRLDWDFQPEATDYFIYCKDPFDSLSSYDLIIDGVSTNNFYEDSSIEGNEGYQYYISGEFCGVEANPSNEVLALLENAEDNVTTTSEWITDAGGWGEMSDGRTEFAPYGICYKVWAPTEILFTPANGDLCWHHSGWDGWYGTPWCSNMWTSHFTLLCSPEIPIMNDATTAYVEYNVLVNILAPMFEQAGGSVGVADSVLNDAYWPSNDLREGWGYNIEHIEGLSRIWTYTNKSNFPNCTSVNDYGYALQPGYEYHFAAYNLPDLLTTENARVTFVWGSSNSATFSALNYDDIAVIVY